MILRILEKISISILIIIIIGLNIFSFYKSDIFEIGIIGITNQKYEKYWEEEMFQYTPYDSNTIGNLYNSVTGYRYGFKMQPSKEYIEFIIKDKKISFIKESYPYISVDLDYITNDEIKSVHIYCENNDENLYKEIVDIAKPNSIRHLSYEEFYHFEVLIDSNEEYYLTNVYSKKTYSNDGYNFEYFEESSQEELMELFEKNSDFTIKEAFEIANLSIEKFSQEYENVYNAIKKDKFNIIVISTLVQVSFIFIVLIFWTKSINK